MMKHLMIAAALTVLMLSGVVRAADEAGFTPLFDGKSLKGWVNDKGEPATEGGWVAQDGVLHMKPGSKAGNLFTEKAYGDFIFDWEWKLESKGNNGVKYRGNKFDKGGWLGLEYQMIDDGGHADGHKPISQTASIYALYPPIDGKPLKPIGQWNSSRIVAKGPKVEHWLNGVKVAEADISTDDFEQRVAASKWKAVEGFGVARRGKIMITDHKDPVWIRNVRIKPLDAAE